MADDWDILSVAGLPAPGAQTAPRGAKAAAAAGPDPDDILGAAGLMPPSGMATDVLPAAGIPGVDETFITQGRTPMQPYWTDDFMHQLTGGLMDKADAVLQATAGWPGGGSRAPDWGTRYKSDLGYLRQDYDTYEDQNPEGARLAKGAGVVAPMLASGGAAAPLEEGATIGGQMLRGVRSGAGWGAAYGFGGTDDSSVSQDLMATGLGGLGGGLMGGLLPGATSVLGMPARAAKQVIAPMRTSSAEGIAGRVLNEAAGGGAPNMPPIPLPGMKPTLGQRTNNPGLLWLERSVQQSSPAGAAMSAESATANNQAIRGAMGQLGDPETDASATMLSSLATARDAAKANTQRAWKAAGVTEATNIPTAPLKEGIGAWYNGLTKADRALVPGELFKPLSQFGDQESLAEVQGLRSLVSGKVSQAYRAGDNNLARILGGANDVITNFAENPPDAGAGSLLNTDPDLLAKYAAARQATRAMHATFTDPKPINQAVRGITPPSAIADQFVRTGKGAPEALASYLTAVKGNPEGLQAARDAFTQKFFNAVENTNVDQAGDKTISPARVSKFLDSYQHVVNSPLFTDAQRGVIKSISDASDMAARTVRAKPPGGSDTFPKLMGDKFVNVLLGQNADKLIKGTAMAAGAVGGGHAAGPVGAIAGLVGGSHGGGLVEKLYGATRDRSAALIVEAMHDPDLAQALMMKASPGNEALIKPATRAKMLGILGAQTGRIAAPLVQAAQ